MTTSRKSSGKYSAILTPLKSSPEIQRGALLLAMCLAAWPILALSDKAQRSVLCALLLATAGVELWRLCRQTRPPQCIRLTADGIGEGFVNGRWQALEIGPGSVLGGRLGWLCLSWASGRRCTIVVLAGRNPRAWRRAKVIWRWAPNPPTACPESPRFGVNSLRRRNGFRL